VPLTPPVEKSEEKLKCLDAGLVFNPFEGFSACPETKADTADILSALGLAYPGCPAPTLRLTLEEMDLSLCFAVMPGSASAG
jgi:hypothetical protein